MVPPPSLVWFGLGLYLALRHGLPSPPPRTPGSAGLFHFKSQQSIHVCVWRVEVKKFQENVSFLVKQRKAERGRERGWVGLVMSCHVMSCHGKEGLLPFDQIADHDAPESSSSSSSFLGGRSVGRAALDQRRQANTRPWFEVEGGGLIPGRGEGEGGGGGCLGFCGGGGVSIKRKRPQEGKKSCGFKGCSSRRCCSPSRS